jgi:hypothetical protein
VFGKFENIYVLGDIGAIAEEYNKLCELTYEHSEYIDPFEDILDPQEYGTDCYCYISLNNSSDWNYVVNHNPSDEFYHYHRSRARFIDFIRDNVPAGVDKVLVEVSY